MTHAAHCGGLMSRSPSLGLSSYRRRQTTGSLMTLTPFSLLIHHQLRLIQTPYWVGYTVQCIAGTCSHCWASSLMAVVFPLQLYYDISVSEIPVSISCVCRCSRKQLSGKQANAQHSYSSKVQTALLLFDNHHFVLQYNVENIQIQKRC